MSNTKSRSTVRVLIADQQTLFSSALAVALADRPEITVWDKWPTSGSEVMRAVGEFKPDVVLLDFWMDGPSVTRDIGVKFPNCKVMLLSWLQASGQVQEAVASGAVGFLPKSLGLGEVAEAVRRAHAGESLVYAEELHKLVETIDLRHEKAEHLGKQLKELSPREFQILLLLGQGRLIQDAARELNITQATVTAHINRILRKTGARSHAEVLAMARAAGLIQT